MNYNTKNSDYEQHNQWYPIVYSRSFDVDYRFLRLPPLVSEPQLRKIKLFVKSAATEPDGLFDAGPRWFFVRSGSYSIFGAATSCVNILPKDKYNRDVWSVIAYFTFSPNALMPSRLFSNLDHGISIIREHWNEISHNSKNFFFPSTISLNPDLSIDSDDFNVNSTMVFDEDVKLLNEAKNRCFDPAYSDYLWGRFKHGVKHGSLCLDYPTSTTIKEFTTVTSTNFSNREFCVEPSIYTNSDAIIDISTIQNKENSTIEFSANECDPFENIKRIKNLANKSKLHARNDEETNIRSGVAVSKKGIFDNSDTSYRDASLKQKAITSIMKLLFNNKNNK